MHLVSDVEELAVPLRTLHATLLQLVQSRVDLLQLAGVFLHFLHQITAVLDMLEADRVLVGLGAFLQDLRHLVRSQPEPSMILINRF